MQQVRIEFHDDGPDKDDRRRYCLFWWSPAQQRQRAQEFNSAQWREHQKLAEIGHD